MFGADDDLRLVRPGLRGEAAVTRALTVHGLEAVHTVLLANVLLTTEATVKLSYDCQLTSLLTTDKRLGRKVFFCSPEI